MAIKVITSTDAWEGFLRRAKRAFPQEHVEAIWGEETVESYRITDFRKLKTTNTASSIDYDETEVRRQKWLAQQQGKIFLGTVHTHPSKQFDTSPSETDHREGLKDDEKVMGIVVLYKKKDSERFIVETNWWIPQPLIEFVLLSE
jgi:proteasome lid subunit RPN8/RPN11